MPSIARVILYVRNIPKVAGFYERHFAMRALPSERKDWLELSNDSHGCTIALHQASAAQKSGAAMKIVFAVTDVPGFKKKAGKAGLRFGTVHAAEGFEFANAKDPAGNSIQISSRGLR
jgi:predicted enzyme related to lactoylglutathione lyase